MDWNKTKTIFIIVFTILNIFLYSLYVNRYNQANEVEPLGEASLAERLRVDNIQLKSASEEVKEESYVSGTVHVFSDKDAPVLNDVKVQIVDNTKKIAALDVPYAIRDLQDMALWNIFLNQYVYRGSSYKLWSIDEKNKVATFFQHTGGRSLFHSQFATLKVYWNEEKEIVQYEQSAFDDLERFPDTEKLITQDRVISTLYSQNKLPPNSAVMTITLGLSTLVQLPETQVFAPTWQVKVKLEDGTEQNYFVNAVQGGIIEFEE